MTGGNDLSALSDLLEDHVRAVNSGDVDRLLEHFAEDVVYLSSGLSPILGRSQLEALIRPFYADNQPRISMTPHGRSVEGDLAWEWGTGSGEINGKAGGDATKLDFKYLFLYRRGSDGRWRLVIDMTNDNPADSEP